MEDSRDAPSQQSKPNDDVEKEEALVELVSFLFFCFRYFTSDLLASLTSTAIQGDSSRTPSRCQSLGAILFPSRWPRSLEIRSHLVDPYRNCLLKRALFAVVSSQEVFRDRLAFTSFMCAIVFRYCQLTYSLLSGSKRFPDIRRRVAPRQPFGRRSIDM